jgi:predicted nucleic-acid-binding Zn-ribbon protein
MSTSKCPKCERTQFELIRPDHIKGANQPMYFVQCVNCNTVVGVTEFYDTAALLEKIAKKIGIPDLLDY